MLHKRVAFMLILKSGQDSHFNPCTSSRGRNSGQSLGGWEMTKPDERRVHLVWAEQRSRGRVLQDEAGKGDMGVRC